MFAAGFEAIADVPGARLVGGLMVAQTFVRGCLNVLIVVAAYRVLHAGAGAVGYMTAAIGVGGLLGALGAMTLGGARLLGMADDLGAIAPGRKADVVLLRADSPFLRPLNHATRALVYAETGSYRETARRLDLDRRTVKDKVDPEPEISLTGGCARCTRGRRMASAAR